MKRKLSRLAALLAALVVACGMSVGTATAKPHRSSTNCVDHADNGKGNRGDPGNGQGHFCNDV